MEYNKNAWSYCSLPLISYKCATMHHNKQKQYKNFKQHVLRTCTFLNFNSFLSCLLIQGEIWVFQKNALVFIKFSMHTRRITYARCKSCSARTISLYRKSFQAITKIFLDGNRRLFLNHLQLHKDAFFSCVFPECEMVL